MYQLSSADSRELDDDGLGDATTVIEYAAKPRATPLVISVGTMCIRR